MLLVKCIEQCYDCDSQRYHNGDEPTTEALSLCGHSLFFQLCLLAFLSILALALLDFPLLSFTFPQFPLLPLLPALLNHCSEQVVGQLQVRNTQAFLDSGQPAIHQDLDISSCNPSQSSFFQWNRTAKSGCRE